MNQKMQLFDVQLVCEMITAAIIVYMTEKKLNENVDEDEIADFVIRYFPQILDIVTDKDLDKDVSTDSNNSG